MEGQEPKSFHCRIIQTNGKLKSARQFSRVCTFSFLTGITTIYGLAAAEENPSATPIAAVSTIQGEAQRLGTVKTSFLTPLGELELRDSDGDGYADFAMLGEKIVVATKVGEGNHTFTLHPISWSGQNDKKSGKHLVTMLIISQSQDSCQNILIDASGRELWTSTPFPDVQKFPGWVQRCMDITYVSWKPPYPAFYFGPSKADPIFAYSSKLKAVFGPIDSDDVPPHPKNVSLVPRPVEILEAEKKGK